MHTNTSLRPFNPGLVCPDPTCKSAGRVYPRPERDTPQQELAMRRKPGRYTERKRELAPVVGKREARWLNPWHPDYRHFIASNPRCAIGRHAVADVFDLWFELDGKYLCKDHILAIVESYDQIRDDPGVSQYELTRQAARRDTERAKREHIETMRREAGSQPGFVYYLRIGEYIKIGYAADVTARMRDYPPNAELLAVHPGTPDMEKAMHRQFNAFLQQGREWFSPGPSLLEHIAAVVARFPNHEKLAHRYRRARL